MSDRLEDMTSMITHSKSTNFRPRYYYLNEFALKKRFHVEVKREVGVINKNHSDKHKKKKGLLE